MMHLGWLVACGDSNSTNAGGFTMPDAASAPTLRSVVWDGRGGGVGASGQAQGGRQLWGRLPVPCRPGRGREVGQLLDADVGQARQNGGQVPAGRNVEPPAGLHNG